MTSATTPRVLVVDDYEPNARACAEALRAMGLGVAVAAGPESALAEARRSRPNVVLLDAGLSPGGGVGLLRRLDAEGLTADARALLVLPPVCSEEVAGPARAAADALLQKPFSAAELERTVRELLESGAPPKRSRLEREGYPAGPPSGAGASAVAESLDMAGVSVAGCRIERLLGRGGMGAVYLARHEVLDTPVAVKLLPRSALPWESEQVDRLIRGARAAARIQHPNVVPVLHAGEEGRFVYVVTRYVEGRSLQALLDERGRLSVAEAVRVLIDVGQGLAAAHAEGIVHRDVKPGNVLVTPAGAALLTDFGLARPAGPRDITSSGNIVGTPHYMSPEQCNGEPADARSDIYSLGATVYHCLTGRRPAEGPSPLVVLRRQVECAPEPVASLCPECPPALCDIVQRMMRKRPEERYPSAREMLDDARGLGLA